MFELTLGDLRRSIAELPDSARVHLADPETLRALGEPVVWEGALYLPILEPTAPTPSRVGIQMRWADEALGWRLHTEEDGHQDSMTVREFLALYPDPLEQANGVLAAAPADEAAGSASGRPRTRLQILFGSALDALAGRDRHATRTPRQERAAAVDHDSELTPVSSE